VCCRQPDVGLHEPLASTWCRQHALRAADALPPATNLREQANNGAADVAGRPAAAAGRPEDGQTNSRTEGQNPSSQTRTLLESDEEVDSESGSQIGNDEDVVNLQVERVLLSLSDVTLGCHTCPKP
jgi:hypothetical protein